MFRPDFLTKEEQSCGSSLMVTKEPLGVLTQHCLTGVSMAAMVQKTLN